MGGTGGPEQSENGSGLKIFLNQPVDGISLKRLGGGWSWFIDRARLSILSSKQKNVCLNFSTFSDSEVAKY